MRRTRRHQVVALALLSAVVGGLLAGTGMAQAAITSATPTPTSVVAAPDFATATYNDAWDYANAEDFDKSLESWMVGGSNVTMANGMLSFDMTSMGQLPLVRGFGEIAIPWGRDGSLNPIPAATYTKLSFRMNAQIGQNTAGQITWMNCGNFIHECHGAQPITIKPGWNTYDITLQNQYGDLPAAWAGQIHSLVIVPIGGNISSGRIDLDWVRLYQPTATVAVDLVDSNPGGQITASWQATPTASQYVSSANRTAVFATANSSSTTRVNFNAAAFPAGTYRFFGTDGDGAGPAGDPLTISPRAGASKLAPEVRDGADYASQVRGDAWDFSQPSDVASYRNMTMSFASGLGHGRNAGPTQNDPWFQLAMGSPIDGSRYHRLSMRVHYDGGFALTDTGGGGMNGRLYWGIVGSSVPQSSQDILVYPGWQTITMDLDWHNLHDEGQAANTRVGWVGQQHHWFRFDPNEDRGERTFAVDWIRLGGTSPFGSFDHAARVAGGIAVGGWAIGGDSSDSIPVHVYVNGAGYALQAGDNRPDIAAAFPGYGAAHGFNAVVPAGPGTHNVCAYAINLAGGNHTPLGCKSVTVDPLPFGSFDSAKRVAGGIAVGGWAIDPDVATPIGVHVYVDQQGYALRAGDQRGDIAAAFPSYGSPHGFNGVVPAGPGWHQVCAYAINEGPGHHTSLGCHAVFVDSAPFGSLDLAGRTAEGIRVAGWAIDPDTAGAIDIHVYVDGAGHNLGPAANSRGDVAAAFASYGPNHGFDAVVPASPGSHNVCAYGINQGPGHHVTLGCRRVG